MKNIIDPKEIHLISEGMVLSILAFNDNEEGNMSVHIPILTLIDIFKEYEQEELRMRKVYTDIEMELTIKIQELRKLIPSELKDNGIKLPNFTEFKRIKLAEKNLQKLNN